MKSIAQVTVKSPHLLATKYHAVQLFRRWNDANLVCRRYHISRASLYRWNKRFDGTKESLRDGSHRPLSQHPNAHTDTEIKWIKDYHRRNPNISICELFGKLREEKGYSRHPGSLYRVFVRLGYRKHVESTKKKSKHNGKYDTPEKLGIKWQMDVKYVPNDLSELIRTELSRNDLYVFDGNPDRIVSRIVVEYRRTTKIKPNVVLEGTKWDYVTWDYYEKLFIDRQSETLELHREIGTGCKITNTYYIQEGIADFLDTIDMDSFAEIKGNPPDVIDNPLDVKTYTVALYSKQGSTRIISGTYDKNSLPTEWPDFISSVYEFMAFYGIGELFNECVYGNEKRRKTDLIFCNVVFEDGGQTYCYIADTDDYCEGDLVVVPAGADNHEAVVRIESIEYHSAGDAPFPIEKMKHILFAYNEEYDADPD